MVNLLNLELWLYTLITALSYLITIVILFGVLKSISQSYYEVKGFGKAIFTLFIWSISIPMMIIGSTPLMFFAGALLSFVGAAPAFKEEMEGKVHVIGATGGILIGFI